MTDVAISLTPNDVQFGVPVTSGGLTAGQIRAIGQMLGRGRVARTGAFTATASDRGQTFDCSGTFTVGFSAAASLGDGWHVIIANNGAGVVTLDPSGAETISGAATLALNSGQSAVVLSTGTALIATAVMVSDPVQLSGSQTITGQKTFEQVAGTIYRQASTQDAVRLLGRSGGTSSFSVTITPLALSASRTWSLPDRADTFAGLGAQTFTGDQTISRDTSATGQTALILSRSSGSNLLDQTWHTAGVLRWLWRMQNADTGANAGSDLSLRSRDDAGSPLVTVLTFTRANGNALYGSSTEATSTSVASVVISGGLGLNGRGFLGAIATTFKGHVIAGVQDGTADTVGAVGETLNSTVTAAAAGATGTPANATSVSVTRGKWMGRASVTISGGATGLTNGSTFKVSISTISATNGTNGSTMVQQSVHSLVANGLHSLSINIPDINISAAATYFLVVECAYAAGSPTIAGSLTFTRTR